MSREEDHVSNPTTPDHQTGANGWEGQARKLLEADRAREARTLLNEQNPEDDRGRLVRDTLLARADAALGSFDDAERRINAVLQSIETAALSPDSAYSLEVEARLYKSDLLLQAEGIELQERFLKECLNRPLQLGDRARFVSDLAFNCRKAGRLKEAARLIEEVVGLLKETRQGVPLFYFINLALIHTHAGAFEPAASCLATVNNMGVYGHEKTAFELTSAFLALQSGELEECEKALSRADQSMTGDNFRLRVIWAEYKAELRLLQGMFEEAKDILEELMSSVNEKAAHSDLVPEVARRLASVYLALDRPNDALSYALRAEQTGAQADVLEQIAGLRTACECYVGIGDLASAEGCLKKVRERFARIEDIEFVSERAALAKAIAKTERLKRMKKREEAEPTAGQSLLDRQLKEIGKELERSRAR